MAEFYRDVEVVLEDDCVCVTIWLKDLNEVEMLQTSLIPPRNTYFIGEADFTTEECRALCNDVRKKLGWNIDHLRTQAESEVSGA